jgi:hypothetical protein
MPRISAVVDVEVSENRGTTSLTERGPREGTRAVASRERLDQVRTDSERFGEDELSPFAIDREKQRAEEIELEHHRERALAVAAANRTARRAKKHRDAVATDQRRARQEWEDRKEMFGTETSRKRTLPNPEHECADPREALDSETLGQVNQSARRIEETRKYKISEALVAKQIARVVLAGRDVMAASFDVIDWIEEREGERRALEDIEAWDVADWVSIEAEVATLFEPACASQQQVGYLIQNGETVKFTIWAKSGQSVTLEEGDRITVDWAAINTYQGEPTLAATSDTRIEILERDDSELGEASYTEQDVEAIGACRLPPIGSE